MKVVYIKEFGGPENLEVREIPDPPKPRESQLLIRVRAAGLNRADIMQRRGAYLPPAGYSPNVPGLEFAGEVIETGAGATHFKVGDRVFGITAGEAQAEKILIDESSAAVIPPNLDFVQAAAVPEAFITAQDAVFAQAQLQNSETLLIHAVGSGVGLAALQLAKARVISVIGTSRSDEKLSRCVDFGLDVSITAGAKPKFAETVMEHTGAVGANVILDLVGAAYFAENIASIAVKGRLMVVGLTSGAETEINLGTLLRKRVKITGTVLRSRSPAEKAEAVRQFVDEVIPLFVSGKIVPNVDRVFALADISAAHKYMESNTSFGKIVIVI